MSDIQDDNDKVLHQDSVEDVVTDVLDDEVQLELTAIADLAAPSATYVEAEALAARNKINAILAALRAADIVSST